LEKAGTGGAGCGLGDGVWDHAAKLAESRRAQIGVRVFTSSFLIPEILILVQYSFTAWFARLRLK
jgi:hypothetical protein